VVYYLCGVFFELSISRFGGCFTKKNPISALQKRKKRFSWVETKIGHCGVPRHPKGHARAQYGFIPTNYAMVIDESSSFLLKVMSPRTW
jgi:hypothetical protein